SAIPLCVKEYRPDDLGEFRVSDVPVVHAAWVIRPCALDRLWLDADRPQDSAHPRWLHAEQCRQFQDCDSHRSRRPPLVFGRSIIWREFSIYTSKTIYFLPALWYSTIEGCDLFVR